MKMKDVQELAHGIYSVYWKDGSASLASVGSLYDGTRWLAPTNWISVEMNTEAVKKIWRRNVERVAIILEHETWEAIGKLEEPI